jgi:nucleotide-binding universal stress UspA family protein
MGPSILVASDGSPAALGALRLANALADETQAAVELFGVVDPVPVFDAGFLVAIPETELYEGRQGDLRIDLEDQLEEVTGSRDSWPIRVAAGLRGPRIVKRAQEFGASLIILGLGRHKPVDRIFGTETALQVIRLSHIPVLAVPEGTTTLPTSAALGVDFSHFSRRATQAAFSVMKSPWVTHLVHVMSGMEFLPIMSEEWRTDYEDELRARLSNLSGGLTPPQGCRLTFHVREGEPGQELLAFTEERSIQLLVAGSHGLSFIGRLLMGSVSTRLIRDAHVPVLVVPPGDLTEEVFSTTDPPISKHPWVTSLDEFTRANAGRRTTLELLDPELGRQECGRGFPLWGVDFDPRKNRLDIMLGRSGTVEGHLTHSIPDPKDVEVKSDEKGRATALRIRLAQGEVTLKIHRK